MKVREIIGISNNNSTRILILKVIAVLIPGLIFSMLTVALSPLLAAGLFVFSVFCIVYWIWPKRALLAFGVFLVFQSLLIRYIGGVIGVVLKFDEIFILTAFVLTVLQRFSKGQPVRFMPVGLLLLGMTAMGFLSSYVNHLTGTFAALAAYLLMIKGFLFFFIFLNTDLTESETKVFAKTFLVIGFFIVLTTIVNIASPGPFNKFIGASRLFYRMGMLSAVSIFGHPAGLGTTMGIFTCFALAFYIVIKDKRFLIITIIFLLTMLLSLRVLPAVGFFSAVLLAALVLPSMERKRAILFLVFVGVIISLAFAEIIVDILSGAVSSYITKADPYKVARDVLYITGFKIATSYFPFGAGLGTFGSYISKVYYSSLYYKYGLNRIWGLSPKTGQFISDTFWPHIMAELGFVGCILYLWILFLFIKYAIKGIKTFSTPLQRAFAIGVFMMLIVSFAHSIKGAVYEQSLWAYLIFGSMGILCSWQFKDQTDKKQ